MYASIIVNSTALQSNLNWNATSIFTLAVLKRRSHLLHVVPNNMIPANIKKKDIYWLVCLVCLLKTLFYQVLNYCYQHMKCLYM